MTDALLEITLKRIERRAERVDAVLRGGESAAAVAYQIGIFMAELKQTIADTRARMAPVVT